MRKNPTKQTCLWLIFLLIIFSLKPVMGQDKQMVVHKTDGTTMMFEISNIKELSFSGITGIAEMKKISNASLIFELLKTYPNPVTSGTTLEYRIDKPGPVKICIYNQQGVLVKELLNRNMPSGNHNIKWDAGGKSGTKVKPGVYLCTIHFNNQSNSKRIIVIE